MFSRRLLTATSRLSRTTRTLRPLRASAPLSTARCLQAAEPAEPTAEDKMRAFLAAQDPEKYDPEMNGGYINPPAIKRQHRDPYGDWWDKQERRNFGEPVHEDNDVLGMFSLYDYTHMTPARGFLLWGGFISVVLGLSYTVSRLYPDRPSAPNEFESGLAEELGGKGAVRAWQSGDEL